MQRDRVDTAARLMRESSVYGAALEKKSNETFEQKKAYNLKLDTDGDLKKEKNKVNFFQGVSFKNPSQS